MPSSQRCDDALSRKRCAEQVHPGDLALTEAANAVWTPRRGRIWPPMTHHSAVEQTVRVAQQRFGVDASLAAATRLGAAAALKAATDHVMYNFYAVPSRPCVPEAETAVLPHYYFYLRKLSLLNSAKAVKWGCRPWLRGLLIDFRSTSAARAFPLWAQRVYRLGQSPAVPTNGVNHVSQVQN